MSATTVVDILLERSTRGIFADLSNWPKVDYYCECPVCHQVHGNYRDMREAHAKRVCQGCHTEHIEKLKKRVQLSVAPTR